MATYNGAPFLAEQLDSILMQLAPGDELLVSDDASTDETVEILSSYGNRLRLVGTSRAGGVVRNFERVLSFASGEAILLSDQDDVWLPGRLEVMREELEKHELILTNALVTDASLRPTGATLFDRARPAVGFWRNLLQRSAFVGCCLGFRRSLLKRALPFPGCTPWHDWLLGLLASLNGPTRQIETPLLLFRRHDGNASLTGEKSKNNTLQKAHLRLRIATAVAICILRAPSAKGSLAAADERSR